LVRDRVIAIRAGIVFNEHTDEDGATAFRHPASLASKASCQHNPQVPGTDIRAVRDNCNHRWRDYSRLGVYKGRGKISLT
jgi:hypothetical protein